MFGFVNDLAVEWYHNTSNKQNKKQKKQNKIKQNKNTTQQQQQQQTKTTKQKHKANKQSRIVFLTVCKKPNGNHFALVKTCFQSFQASTET